MYTPRSPEFGDASCGAWLRMLLTKRICNSFPSDKKTHKGLQEEVLTMSKRLFAFLFALMLSSPAVYAASLPLTPYPNQLELGQGVFQVGKQRQHRRHRQRQKRIALPRRFFLGT